MIPTQTLRHRRLHATRTGPLADAIAPLPDYPAIAAAFEAAVALRRDAARLPSPERLEVELIGRITTMLRAGDVMDVDELTAAAQATAAATAAAGLRIRILDAALVDLAHDVDHVLEEGQAAIFAHLDGQLQAMLREARTLDLGGVESADAAIRAGRVPEWTALAEHVQAFTALRGAHREAFSSFSSDQSLDRALATFGLVRDLPRVWPEWFDGQRSQPRHTHNGDGIVPTPPWPNDDTGALLWFLHHPEVQLWAPTPAQVGQARAAATHAATRVDLTPHEQAAAAAAERDHDRKVRAARPAMAAARDDESVWTA